MSAWKRALVLSMSILAWCCASVDRQADDLFASGEYSQAAQAYEAYLDADPSPGPETSRALYRLAVTYGSSMSSGRSRCGLGPHPATSAIAASVSAAGASAAGRSAAIRHLVVLPITARPRFWEDRSRTRAR